MQFKSKPGIDKDLGIKYQDWFAVDIIRKWVISDDEDSLKQNFWLKREIGRKKSGIFDDLMVYYDNRVRFLSNKTFN